jgi:hypothetical protein
MNEARLSHARSRSSSCASCSTPAGPGARFCQTCGRAILHPIDPVCPHCQATCLPGTRYCETCGAGLPPTPYLIVAATGIRLALFTGESATLVIGRADTLSGVMPDLDLEPYSGALSGLSRRHADLTWRDGRCWIEDLNSVNLTYLNQQRLAPQQPVPLKDGDRLRLGNVLLTYREN